MQSAGRGARKMEKRLAYEKSILGCLFFSCEVIKVQLVFDGFLQVLHHPG